MTALCPTVANLWLDDDCEDDSWACPEEILDGADDIRETTLTKMMGGPQTKLVLLFSRAWCDLLGAIGQRYPALTRIIIDCNYVSHDNSTIMNLNVLPKTLRYISLRTSQSEVDCRHLLEFPDLEICVLDTRIVHTEALARLSNLRWLVLYNMDKVEGLERVHPADLTESRALRKALKRVFYRARGEPYYFVRPQ